MCNLNDFSPALLDSYTEEGVENGAKINEQENVFDDLSRFLSETRCLNLDDTLAWIVKQDNEQNRSTHHVRVSFQRESLNSIRHLDHFLKAVNGSLEQGGCIICHCRTSGLEKRLIFSKYPPMANSIIYLFHYLWHRIMPKLCWLTNKIYFGVSKSTNRSLSRVEVLGRLCKAGFEIIDERFKEGEFFIIGRKVTQPIENERSSTSPIIRLNRIGKDGKFITVYKFRTMHSYSEYLQPYIYKYNSLTEDGNKFANDYRISTLGKFMRKIWLDELPMIYNVLKGDLKLVGVRPLSQQYFSLYSRETQLLRVKAKPGLLPPFYYEKRTPRTMEEKQESECRYTTEYLEHPFYTDWKYFGGIVTNIILRGKHSE